MPNPDRRNPYWPGTILWLDDTGEPSTRERIGGVAGVTQLVAVERHASGGSGRSRNASAWPPAESQTLVPLGWVIG